MLDFKGSWIQYLPLIELATTIVSKQLLGWHRIKCYMDTSVIHPSIGIMDNVGGTTNFGVRFGAKHKGEGCPHST